MKSYRTPREPIKTIEIPLDRSEYGFMINIGHELIAPLFQMYKVENGLNLRFPISDYHRRTFEMRIKGYIDAYGENIEEFLRYTIEELEK